MESPLARSLQSGPLQLVEKVIFGRSCRPNFARQTVAYLRVIAGIAFIFFLTVSQLSAANTFNGEDETKIFNLLNEAVRIEGDVNYSLQSVRLSDAFTNECLIDAAGQIDGIVDELSSAENLVLMSSKMINEADETFVSMITKKYLKLVLQYVQQRRRMVNQLLGRCARSPLVVAKGEAILELLHQMDIDIRSLQRR